MRYLLLVLMCLKSLAFSSEEKSNKNHEITYLDQETIKLYTAIKNGDLTATEIFLRGTLSQKLNTLHKDVTPLMLAAELGKGKVVDLLLEFNGLEINKTNSAELTALHIACTKGHEEVIFKLLNENINANLTDKSGNTPLMYAILSKKFDLAEKMAGHKKIDINIADKQGQTPLIKAISLKAPRLAYTLAIDPISNLDAMDKDGRSALFLAETLNIDKKIESYLRQETGGYCTDIFGHNALTLAAESGRNAAVKNLISLEPNINTPGPKGKTPIYLAATHDHENIVDLLIQHKGNVNLPDEDGHTPLMTAAVNSSYASAQILLAENADIHTQSKKGATALSEAKDLKMISLLMKNKASLDYKILKKNMDLKNVGIVKHLLKSYISKLEVLQKIEILTWVINNNLNSIKNILWEDANTQGKLNTKIKLPEYKAKDTLLTWAIKKENIFIIDILMLYGANIEQLDYAGKSPLHWAANNGQIAMINRLLQAKANINVQNKEKVTPLMLAAKKGQKQVVELLLKKGADKTLISNQGTALFLAIKEKQFEIVGILATKDYNLETEIKTATSKGDSNVITYFLENLDLSIEQRRQILILNYSNQEIAKKLLEAKDIPIKSQVPLPEDNNKDTVLVLSAYNGHISSIKALLAYGFDINQTGQYDGSPLYWSASKEKYEAAKILLEHGANINIPNNAGNTPLMKAAMKGDTKVVELLLEYGANLTNKNNEEKTALDLAKNPPIKNMLQQANNSYLHWAAAYGKVKVIEKLLEKNANINIQDKDGITPLMLAAKKGQKQAVELLLKEGSDRDLISNQGTALYIAFKEKNYSLAKLIGNDEYNFQYEIKTASSNGNITAITWILENFDLSIEQRRQILVLNYRRHDITAKLLGAKDIPAKSRNIQLERDENQDTILTLSAYYGQISQLKSLLAYGFDIDQTGQYNGSPLYWAVSEKKHNTVKFLLEHGANTEVSNSTNNTPLIIAAERGETKTVELLLEHGANLKAKNNDGETALDVAKKPHIKNMLKQANKSYLHWAAAYGKTKAIRKLLQDSVNINIKDKDRITPLMLAASNGHKETVELLLENGADRELISKNGTALYLALKSDHCETANLIATNEQNCKCEIRQAIYESNSNVISHLLNNFPLTIEQKREILIKFYTNNSVAKKLLEAKDIPVANQNIWLPKVKGRDTPLTLAADEGRLTAVKAFIAYGFDINQTGACEGTPLFWAVKKGHYETAKFLLENGADTTISSNLGATPLIRAASKNYKKIVEILLEHEADISAKDNNGKTALYLTTNLHIQNMLKQASKSHLHWAVAYNKIKTIEKLLKNNVNINTQDKDGISPLMLAADKDHAEAVELLLKNGADRTIVSKKGTALYLALKKGHYKTAELIAHPEYNFENEIKTASSKKNTHITSWILDNFHLNIEQRRQILILNYDKEDIVKKLMSEKDIPTQENNIQLPKDSNKHTALTLSAIKGYTRTIDALLAYGFDVNQPGRNESTPLLRASIKSINKQIVKELIEHRANINTGNQDGTTPLMIAANRENKETVSILLANGADINATNNEGKTAWDVAGNTEILNTLEQSKNFIVSKDKLKAAISKNRVQYINSLLGSKIILNKDELLEIALLAIDKQLKNTLELVNLKADNANPSENKAQLPIIEGDHALTKTSFANDILAVATLLKCGADPNQPGDLGGTALYWSHCEEIVDILLEYKADPNIPQKSGETPLIYAIKRNNLPKVIKLIEYGANINAILYGQETILYALDKPEIFELLINHPGINLTPNLVLKLIHKAHENETLNMIELVDSKLQDFKEKSNINLDKTANEILVKILNADDTESLHACIQIFNKLGININMLDKKETPPLFVAIEEDEVKKIKLLLENGADIYAKYQNKTTLDFAYEHNRVNAMNYIINSNKFKLTKQECIKYLELAIKNNHETLARNLIYKAEKAKKSFFRNPFGFSKIKDSFLLNQRDLATLAKKFPDKADLFQRDEQPHQEPGYELQEL